MTRCSVVRTVGCGGVDAGMMDSILNLGLNDGRW